MNSVTKQARKLVKDVHIVDRKLKRIYFEEQLWREYINDNGNNEFKPLIDWYEEMAEYEV